MSGKNLKKIGKEFEKIQKSLQSDNPPVGIESVDPVDGEMTRWNVKINFRDDPKIHERFKGSELGGMILRIRFPAEYPFKPPNVLVHSPCATGKFIMHGGGICMDMLSTGHWTPTMSMESVIIATRSILMDGDTNLKVNSEGVYDEEKAIRSWNSAMNSHGWNDVSRKKARK